MGNGDKPLAMVQFINVALTGAVAYVTFVSLRRFGPKDAVTRDIELLGWKTWSSRNSFGFRNRADPTKVIIIEPKGNKRQVSAFDGSRRIARQLFDQNELEESLGYSLAQVQRIETVETKNSKVSPKNATKNRTVRIGKWRVDIGLTKKGGLWTDVFGPGIVRPAESGFAGNDGFTQFWKAGKYK